MSKKAPNVFSGIIIMNEPEEGMFQNFQKSRNFTIVANERFLTFLKIALV